MFHPTGKMPNGKTLICMMDEEDELDNVIDECESPSQYVEAITEWLNENDYCVECWQLKEYLKAKGMNEDQVNEDMVAAAPAPGLSTLGNVGGMGNPAPPSPAGATNSGFYNPANNGSGDKFSSLTVGTPAAKAKKHTKTIVSYLDFIKKKKKKA
jgi:hypothetical protein